MREVQATEAKAHLAELLRAVEHGETLVSRFVLDASVTVAWLLDDEGGGRANAVLTRLETEAVLVPQHWHLECGVHCSAQNAGDG